MDKKPYAELNLYYGAVSAMGGWEGLFEEGLFNMVGGRHAEQVRKLEKEHYMSAVGHIRRTIDELLAGCWEMGGGIRIGMLGLKGFENFVKDEKEATQLIGWCLKEIPNSGGIIIPDKQKHGRLNFFRKIRFEGVDSGSRDQLISKLMESNGGIVPQLKEGIYPKGVRYPDGLRMEKSYIEAVWDDFLKFYNLEVEN